jgi:myo-inositol-1(or 4)-monophosphatase
MHDIFGKDDAALSGYLASCEEAARMGGEILLSLEGQVHAREKGPNDLVTEADFASQQAIRDFLLGRYPDHQFIGEETEGAVAELASFSAPEGSCPPFRWIVDPLDGTTNYVHNLRGYAVSVALECGGEVLAGVVYDPRSDECFRAAQGQGACLNGSRLRGSGCHRMAEALMAISFAAQTARDSTAIKHFLEILQVCHSIRRLGSAALNLCYVAAGRLDGYVAANVKAWDVAAGMLIVQEAGAKITSLEGRGVDLLRPELACAATPELHAELLGILSRIE